MTPSPRSTTPRRRLPGSHRRLVLALSAASAVVLAGCGAADDPGATSDAQVLVEDFAFGTETLTVTAGTTVTWTNNDDFAHTVTSGSPNQPDGGFDVALGEPNAHESQGTTGEVTFDTAGTFAYFCDLHPSMVGEVVVTDG